MFMADVIENTDTISLTPGGLLLIALIAGGDYNSGLPQCGINIVHALARCGFGDSLLQAVKTLDESALPQFLVTWRINLQDELVTNSQGFLHCRYPNLASNISDSFPKLSILKLYMQPLTSWSPEFEGSMPKTSSWLPQDINVSGLTAFCRAEFRWSIGECNSKFRKHLWPVMGFRMLCSVRFLLSIAAMPNLLYTQPLRVWDQSRLLLFTPSAHTKIIGLHNPTKVIDDHLYSPPVLLRRITVCTDNFVSLMGCSSDLREDHLRLSIWVPEILIRDFNIPKLPSKRKHTRGMFTQFLLPTTGFLTEHLQSW